MQTGQDHKLLSDIALCLGTLDKTGFKSTLNDQKNHETSNGFEALRQLTLHYAGSHRAQHFSLLRTIMSPSWDSNKQFSEFTKQYHRCLEDITDTNQKMALEPLRTIGSHLDRQLLKEYSGTNDESGTIRGVNNDNDPQMIAFNKWMARKGKGTTAGQKDGQKARTKAKTRAALERRVTTITKGARTNKRKNNTITCYTCGKRGHYSQC
eukprot:6241748-Amphidinium_carterae.2